MYLILFNSFFIRAVFSAVFSLTVLSGLLFLLIEFFLVLLSMANKDSFKSSGYNSHKLLQLLYRDDGCSLYPRFLDYNCRKVIYNSCIRQTARFCDLI